MYGDHVTAAMKRAIDETARRRTLQGKYNEEHGIVPSTIVRAIMNVNPAAGMVDYYDVPKVAKSGSRGASSDVDLGERIAAMRSEMFTAAENLDFEKAARLRDDLKKMEALAGVESGGDASAAFNPYGGAKKKSGRAAAKRSTTPPPARAEGAAARPGRKARTR
jgi:excinuclease ABC subunit B